MFNKLPALLLIMLVCTTVFSVNRLGAQDLRRPNILWISCEDMSPRLPFYGDSTISTPNLEQLAREGIVYDRVYTTAGVCAPSRCAIITGVNQVTAGGQNMRTLYNTLAEHLGIPKSYSIVPPPGIKAFPEWLRMNGYYSTNNSKTDYQFIEPPTVWDENSANAGWRGRKPGQPFFAVYNLLTTHESQVWVRKDHPLHANPEKVTIPPIYPDTKTVRKDIARFYSNIADMDSTVGVILENLKNDGLLDSTIIFFWSDHGDGLPYFKRELYDRGIKVPLVVRFPGKKNAGTRDGRLISAIDFAPTVLSLAGIKPPAYMQGVAFLGEFRKDEHKYIFAARDRMDSEPERVRAVRDKRYKYVRNFHPELPKYQPVAYRLQQDMMKEMLDLRDKGQLNAVQMQWFTPTKAPEELYDTYNDPWELKNLADDPDFQKILTQMRKVMDQWLTEVKDQAAIPEKEMIKQMWGGGDKPPVTDTVKVTRKQNSITLSCNTPGASIGYKVISSGQQESTSWVVYNKSFTVQPGQKVKMVAQRIGFDKSKETLIE